MMTRRKVNVFLLITFFVLIFSFIISGITYAASQVTLNIQYERPFNDDNGDGTVGNDKYTVERAATQTVFKIGEGSSKPLNFSRPIYCLRSGLGFGTNSGSISNTGVIYTLKGDMKKDSATVLNEYKNITGVQISNDNYNAILWILDNMYLPKNQDAQIMKEELLKNAEIKNSQLTDDDIEVVQQMAIWYFSNYDENGKPNSLSLPNSAVLSNLLMINNEKFDNDTSVAYNKNRAAQMDQLYEYFLDGANNNKSKYGNDTQRGISAVEPRLTIEKTSPMIEKDNDGNFIAGPFKISEISGTVDYTIDSLKLYDANGDKIEQNISGVNIFTIIKSKTDINTIFKPSLEKTIGADEFYIKIKKTFASAYNLSNVTLKLSYSGQYFNTTAKLWTASNQDQPVVIVDKVKKEFSGQDEIKTTEKLTGKFDIKINKVDEDNKLITAETAKFSVNKVGSPRQSRETINGTIILEENIEKAETFIYEIREEEAPKGYIANLNNIYVQIETGVNSDGTAYEIKSAKLVKLENGQYVDTTIDGVTLSLNGNIVTIIVQNKKKVYDGNYELELVKVDSKNNNTKLDNAKFSWTLPGNTDSQTGTTVDGKINLGTVRITDITTNDIIEITENEAPAGYKKLIESLTLEVTKELIDEKYVATGVTITDGKINGASATLNGNVITIIIPNEKESFDLSLRKYIVSIDDNKLEGNDSRIPEIDITKLVNGEYTAEYKHRKDPLIVNTNSIVTYAITVYNEGEIAGRATEITDQLPTGLEFIDVVSGNYEIENYDKDKNTIVLKENTNNKDLKSFDGEKLDSTTVEIRCKVIQKVEEDNKVLTNVAWISKDYNAVSNEITDRDSNPSETPDVNKDNMSDYTGKNNETDLTNKNHYYEGEQDDDDFEKLIIRGHYFDLSLRKYITEINDEEVENTRIPNIALSGLKTGTSKTAEYKHRKDPVSVNTDDIVTYKLTIYNEGEMAGRATEVTDQLPSGLKFMEVVSGNYELDSYDEQTNRVIFKEKDEGNENLQAFEGETLDSTTITIKCRVVAKASKENQILTNVAWISKDYNAENNTVTDRDSKPSETPDVNKDNMADYTGKNKEANLANKEHYYEGEQDDDDFEKLIIEGKYFDLSLRKYISAVNGKTLTGNDSRIPTIDTIGLKDGSSTTAKYTHSKEPVVVKKGDIVTYTIRVYNEGQTDGYAKQITDYLPEGLGLLVNYKLNLDNLWHISSDTETINLVGENGFYAKSENIKNIKLEDFENTESLNDVKIATGKVKLTTNALDDDLIKAYNKSLKSTDIQDDDKWQQSKDGEDGLYYQDVQVACIVLKDNTYTGTLRNIAEISEAEDKNHDKIENPGDDRDSTPNNVDTENYNPPEDNSSYQEDDDDYELIVLKYFDLALRKFITKVGDEEITTRIPEVSVDKDGNVSYHHDKTPVYVANSDIVTYTIRVYNEGSIDGYAEIVSDDIPEGLEFLPDNETNKEFLWKMYYEKDGELVETENAEKATSIRTTYLSEANGKITNVITDDKTIQENSNLIKAFDRTTMNTPDYRDIKVAFKVEESKIPEENKDRIIINKAQISEDSDDDEDSTPDKWNDGEDDQDKEYVYVKKFDLALLKWVTKSIVTVDGKTTTTETGFAPNKGKTDTTEETFKGIRDNETAEPIAKVEIHRRKIDKTLVKFVYKIRVTNEGELEGYATEITDYIPEGLEFVQEDNPLWKKDGDDKVTTRALETKLLKPGESAELEIVFKWKNGKDNLGQKKNVAEISEDYNDKDAKDIDSTPDTVSRKDYDKEIEDDDDYALVLLTISTGGSNIVAGYTFIIVISSIIITAGTFAIKKYIL